MSIDASSETEILSRIIAPDDPALNAQFAQAVLSFQFQPEDLARMQELAEKAREGRLTSDEQESLENYERVGHFLALLQSKARISLKRAAPGSG